MTLWASVFVHTDVLSQREFLALEAIMECLATIAALYLFLRTMRRRTIPLFWESIHWSANYLSCALCSGVGFLSGVLVRYFFVRNLVFGSLALFSLTGRLIVLVALGTVILQPLIEEIYFRGILFEAISAKIGATWGIGIVTALFLY